MMMGSLYVRCTWDLQRHELYVPAAGKNICFRLGVLISRVEGRESIGPSDFPGYGLPMYRQRDGGGEYFAPGQWLFESFVC